MLVSGAAALLPGIGLLMLADPSVPALQRVQIDPLRLMEAVVAGVSFIGAGAIFRCARPRHRHRDHNGRFAARGGGAATG